MVGLPSRFPFASQSILCTNPTAHGAFRHTVLLALRKMAMAFAVALPLAAGKALCQQETYGMAAPRHSSAQGSTPSGAEPSRIIIYQPDFPEAACGFENGTPRGESEARKAELDKSGPQVSPIFSMSSFSIMGFVKGNWPVVFDYLLEQDSLLIVVIAPEGMAPVIYRLNGKKGHWQNKLMIPASVGDRPLVAQYLIRSLDDGLGQVGPSHLHIHGIAAGPKAVGSIGIDVVTFAPATIHPTLGEKAHYMFHSKSDFKSAEVDFVRLAMSNGQIIAARIGKKSMGSIARDESKNGDWDGKSDGGGQSAQSYPADIQQWLHAPHGQHLVQVRAWWGAKDGDWATALSEDYVTVE
jgi:hypothetical protein